MKQTFKDFTVINAAILFVTHDGVFNKVNYRFEIIKIENSIMYLKKEKFTIFGVNFELKNNAINISDVTRSLSLGAGVCSNSIIKVELDADTIFVDCEISFGAIINRFDIINEYYNDVYFHNDNFKNRFLKIFGKEICWNDCADYKTKNFRDAMVKHDRKKYRFDDECTLEAAYYNTKFNLAGRFSNDLPKKLCKMTLKEVKNISEGEFEKLLENIDTECRRQCRYIWMLLHDEIGLLYDDVYEYLKFGNKLS